MAAPTVRRYMEQNGKDVKLVFRHLPLISIHPNSLAAAEAAEAAGEQGKFFEMTDRLLAGNSQLSPAFIRQTAVDIGLNMARFDAAMAENKFSRRIEADIDEARRLGISSTPTFVINGQQFRGAPQYEQLDAVVKQMLQTAK